jgi:hypothetical protein
MTGERGNDLDSVEVYDPRSNTWTLGPRLPAPVSSLRAAPFGGQLWLVGGARHYDEVRDVWMMASDGLSWASGPPLQVARLGHGLASHGSRLYAAGGLVGGEASSAVEALDTGGRSWQTIAPLPQPRFNLSLVAASGHLYALGGSGTDRRPTSTVYLYEPERDRWTPGPPVPEPLSNFAAVARAGRWLHTVLHKTHFMLDVRSATWSTAPPMPTSRHGLALEAHAGWLYAIGGCSQDPQRDLSVVEAYLPAG